MTDENFNMSLRKFLKTVGVTSQQKIEEAVRGAKAAGTLSGKTVTARMVLTINGIDLHHEVTGEISLSEGD